MSDQNLELIRDQYAATNERDWERAMAPYAPDVEMRVPQGIGYLNTGTLQGHEAVRGWFADWFSSFRDDFQFEITELTEAGDDQVVLAAESHATGRTSGAESHWQVFWLHQLRDGKIVRLEACESLDDAFAKAERGAGA